MKFVLFFLCCQIVYFVYAQDGLQQNELKLNDRLLELRSAKTDEEMDRLNGIFKSELGAFLKLEGAFNYPLSTLKTISILDSKDGLVRLITWNLEYTDLSYTFSGFVMKKDEGREKITITELVDRTDPYTPKPEGIVDAKNWYGALYYKMIPFGHYGKTEYLLIGYDGVTSSSNMKLMDVLTFSGNTPRFGSPVFKGNHSTLKRVVFEYSNLTKMTLTFDEKNGRVVFDHLSPESPALEGVYSYYIPDMSYDAYRYDYDAEIWVLQEDVILTNKEDPKGEKSFYTLNAKTGKVEKNRMNDEWISPQDPAIQNNGNHVARTENETEDQSNEVVQHKPKRKFFRKRYKNPEMLDVRPKKQRQ